MLFKNFQRARNSIKGLLSSEEIAEWGCSLARIGHQLPKLEVVGSNPTSPATLVVLEDLAIFIFNLSIVYDSIDF